mmetsp:Transcript_10205/g.15317  ORF Transcript_10205/g.15317 Transcript_10205/m.15317 type:complete len:92 (+) Transcript_10205:974-1249(+)
MTTAAAARPGKMSIRASAATRARSLSRYGENEPPHTSTRACGSISRVNFVDSYLMRMSKQRDIGHDLIQDICAAAKDNCYLISDRPSPADS